MASPPSQTLLAGISDCNLRSVQTDLWIVSVPRAPVLASKDFRTEKERPGRVTRAVRQGEGATRCATPKDAGAPSQHNARGPGRPRNKNPPARLAGASRRA